MEQLLADAHMSEEELDKVRRQIEAFENPPQYEINGVAIKEEHVPKIYEHESLLHQLTEESTQKLRAQQQGQGGQAHHFAR